MCPDLLEGNGEFARNRGRTHATLGTDDGQDRGLAVSDTAEEPSPAPPDKESHDQNKVGFGVHNERRRRNLKRVRLVGSRF
jgi:hypothetical protein